MANSFEANISELLKKNLIDKKQVEALYAQPTINEELLCCLEKLEAEAFALRAQKAKEAGKRIPKKKKEEFFFQPGDSGLTHLSMCIKEDPFTSLANVIARYALQRRTTFTATARAVYTVYRLFGDCLPVYSCIHGEYVQQRWVPKAMPAALPPMKKNKHTKKQVSKGTVMLDSVVGGQ